MRSVNRAEMTYPRATIASMMGMDLGNPRTPDNDNARTSTTVPARVDCTSARRSRMPKYRHMTRKPPDHA